MTGTEIQKADDHLWKPRAQFIRELVASGVKSPRSNKKIVRLCIEAGYAKPSPEAIYRAAKGYQVKANSPVRPSYYVLCKELLEAFYAGRENGIVITVRMMKLIEIVELCVMQDKMRIPLTPRRYKKKRKRRPKPKDPACPNPTKTSKPTSRPSRSKSSKGDSPTSASLPSPTPGTSSD